MGKVRFHTPYLHEIKIDIDTEKSVDVYIDDFNTELVPDGNIRIVITIEPRDFVLLDKIRDYPNSYTYVLTPYEAVLNNNPKSKYFLSANTWVDPFYDYKKKFAVSTMIGGKMRLGFDGYPLRHELWYRRNEIKMPKDFYLSNDVKVADEDYSKSLTLPQTCGFHNSKTPMFDCMFHIAIENTSLNNYFTEKVIDCFLSKTIPIYRGDKNIGNHFNANAMIEVNSVDEMIQACNSVTPDVYNRLLPIINDNYETALNYQDFNVRIRNAILEVI